jgi:ComF family protein
MPLDKASSTLTHSQDSQAGCVRCRQAPLRLDGLAAYAFHDDPLREAIKQLKYNDLRALAAPLGKLMIAGWASLPPLADDFDIIVPIPLHAARLRERGYNQATLLAHELGIYLQKPVVEDALVRIKNTKPQVELDAQARRDNVKEAFQHTNTDLAGKRVLLVDDVCTTGSTLEAASDALRAGGVSSVWAYTLTRARGDDGPVSNKP